ncbi:hypothetical protein QTJ16_003157 [Diplocarpon rosae]|uniref:Centromere protein X n=1 Tax=Diplocarpon rosae TaxID=946125 RepID=A0AAD9T0V3_9HELO|nr:hypothetical protein QTJ16_003157 [Diplocarpon rosae]
MPPKPFRPPRPQPSHSKGRGRSHGTTTHASTSQRTSTTPRAPKSQAGRERQASRASKPRVSNTSTGRSIGSSDAEGDGDEDLDLDTDPEMAAGEGEHGTADDSDPFSSQTARASRSVPVARGGADDGPSIPPDLINVLLHTFFTQEGTRLHRDANVAVGRYIETFVREGVARADWARVHGWEGELGGGGGGEGGVLEVEDLERAAPQLLLDF